MKPFLAIFIAALLLALLVFNIYFKSKITGIHRELRKYRIDFTFGHILSKSKMEKEILPRYPSHKDLILEFANKIRQSILIAVAIIVLICLCGLVLII